MKKEKIIIIGIHGLGNKPPKEILENWWKRAISDGLNLNNYPNKEFDFELIYWADILHPTPLDVNAKSKSSLFISEPYKSDIYPEQKELLTFREKTIEYLEKYYNNFIVNEVLSVKYPSITEFFIHLHLKDLKTYFSSDSIPLDGKEIPIKEAIIERFINLLDKHKGKKIMLIAHSMGSIIVHDAFTEYSPDVAIDTYVSIGSPLGQKYVLDKYKIENQKNILNKLKVPENILTNWYNLSDLEDQVALNHEIADLYDTNSRKVKIVDQLVDNRFVNEGIRNPHKAFGYLRVPQFSKIVNEFLVFKRPGIFEMIRKIIGW